MAKKQKPESTSLTEAELADFIDKFKFLIWMEGSGAHVPTGPEEAEEIVLQWLRSKRQESGRELDRQFQEMLETIKKRRQATIN